MGKPTGFLEYARQDDAECSPRSRIDTFSEFHTPLSADERQHQAARCMDCGVPFCQSNMVIDKTAYGCPLANLIPEWNENLYVGNYHAALDRLLKTNNFPEFTGRVCPALCESACICGMHSKPVTSKANELSIIEWAFENGFMTPRVPSHRTGKRIAIVGSGPAGLATADCLNQRGHTVTVFEKDSYLGGLLTYGIPEMKLPKSVVFRRTDLMHAEGIEFVTECTIGKDLEVTTLISDYDAIVLCCGTSQPRPVSFESDCDTVSGVYYAADYLKASAEAVLENTTSRISARGKRVAVIGAGDTATDCVAVALRQECKGIIQFVRRPKSDYEGPAQLFAPDSEKGYTIDYGQREAIARFGHDPRIHERVVKKLDINSENELVRLHAAPASHKSDIQESAEIRETYEVDLLIIASGFCGCDPDILDSFGLEPNGAGSVQTQGFHVSGSKIFVAGDMRQGQSLVVWAIAEGRSVAREVDTFLMGYSNMR